MDGALLQYLMPGAFRPSNHELVLFKKDDYGLQDKFAQVKGKVYILHGSKEGFVPVGNSSYAVKKLINASLVDTTIIQGASHFIPWEHYDTIKKVLMKL